MKLSDLNQMINSLEKAAEVKPTTGENTSLVSKELDAVLTKEAAETNVTRAFEDGGKLAAEILQKLAQDATQTKEAAATETTEAATEAVTEEAATQTTITEENVDMNKQAQEAGKALADAILEKLAEGVVGAPTAVNNAGGTTKLQADQAAMVAQHDGRINGTPGRNGTINQVFDAIVARAKGMGAVNYNQIPAGEPSDSAVGAMANAAKSIPVSPDISEKQAAVTALCEAGLGWEDAVELVKAAAVEIEEEEFQQIKAAAVSELVKAGADFESAVEAVEAATAEEAPEMTDEVDGEVTEEIKTAAVSELVAEGYSFDDAVEIIKQASAKQEISKTASEVTALVERAKSFHK